MTALVLLDAGPLGLVTNPNATPETDAAMAWLDGLLQRHHVVGVPEIANYEVRRELLRARRQQGLLRLDTLKARLQFLPSPTDVMLLAARFWAEARQRGRQTASDASLDADMILAAQARVAATGGFDVVVATTNARHLDQFIDARAWQDIR